MTTTLSFGYNRGLPTGIGAAWGARWIYPNDQVPGRTDWIGDETATAELMGWLNGGALSAARDEAARAAFAFEISGGTSDEIVLYEDETGRILANPNASYGYLYVCAYLLKDAQAALAETLDITKG